MIRYNLPINLSTVVRPLLCAFIMTFWFLLINVTVMLLLLDLSPAFGTVDHDILLTRLHSKYSISGIALEWFRSSLTNRSH